MLRWFQQLKNAYHFFQAHIWRLVYGRPDRAMIIFGVTGTNGKTTTCYLLASVLRSEFGIDKVGMLTTVGIWIGRREEVNATKLTTLPSRLVYQYLRDMKKAGVTHVVLEMTSHALDQRRLAGIRLDGAIVLNIEREHLDYHRTMEEYARAKQKITTYLKPGAILVGKADDERVARILAAARKDRELKVVEFTSQEAQVVSIPLEGEFNRENVLAAKLLAESVGIPSEAIEGGIAGVTSVPGRMEWVETGRGFRVLIDYAVTPGALERLYEYVKEKASGRILGILGAAGLRDRGKRARMAEVVAHYADELVVTREDPWTESEEQIFSDLEEGLAPLEIRSQRDRQSPEGDLSLTGLKWRRIPDRREALRYVLGQARAGDTVVVTGKGAERGMGIGRAVVPWNDKEVILELLQELYGRRPTN